jgi:pimeloyl-ACP methyl ester carboxylesterase
MLLASTDVDRIAGAMLNDIGPEIDPTGIDRIGSYVGRQANFKSWDEAAEAITERNQDKFPNWTAADWGRFVRRICYETADGIQFHYDMAIAGNFRAATEGPQGANWHLYEALAGRPVLVLRGELSDLLSADVAEQMAERLGEDAELVVIPAVGHTPNLEEPEAKAAIDRLLDRVMARQEPELS